jgi:hypothetical protein
MQKMRMLQLFLILISIMIITGCGSFHKKISDGSLCVEKNGRTKDAVSNPIKYVSFRNISNKQEFEKEWKKNPGWVFANLSHVAYYDREHIKAHLKKFGIEVEFYDDCKGRQAFLVSYSNSMVD